MTLIDSKLALLITGLSIFPLHIIGLYVLSRNKASLDKIQVVFLFNICLVEAQMIFFKNLEVLLNLLKPEKEEAYEAENYVSIYLNIGCCFPYYITMLLYTLNRFSELYLNLRYNLYWTVKRVKRSIIISWGLAVSASICFMASKVKIDKIYCISYKYVFPILNSLAALLISSTYLYISYKCYHFLKKSKVIKAQLKQNAFLGKQSFPVRKRTLRRYLMPTIFILNFSVFIVIPDSIYCYKYLAEKKIEESFKIFVGLSYFIGFFTDAFIYIFLSPVIRANLLKKLTSKKKFCKGYNISIITQNATSQIVFLNEYKKSYKEGAYKTNFC
ncbi:uncharacterized protein LOC124808208 [Hydra vulgaris]|uniref:uncharacterized protein LOC124808208 n=1 Tax=Hydra vulgaris TaxID=6087 RepID=UPI001F5F8A21|nr:uncharacterized protein LOC124808208 [Hydra vulgaris]